MNFSALNLFLNQLSENNHKIWFDENRPQYESLRKDWLHFVQELITAISSFDADISELEPKNCIFRINRDVRFSKDKSPYKTNFGAYFSKGGKKSLFGGYYIHIDPKETFLAGGMWMPEPPQLQAIRQEIDYHFTDFKFIIENPVFKKNFTEINTEQKTVGIPKGYEKDNPAAEYLKLKNFVVMHKISLSDLENKDATKNISTIFKTIKPFNDFLNKAIDS